MNVIRPCWIQSTERQNCGLLKCEKGLAIITHTTHLFEEPGALAEVESLATCWFYRHLLPDDDR
jgi:hypothetical protein